MKWKKTGSPSYTMPGPGGDVHQQSGEKEDQDKRKSPTPAEEATRLNRLKA